VGRKLKRRVKKRFIKPLNRELGWLLLSRVIAALKSNTDMETLALRAERISRLGFALAGSRRNLLIRNLRMVLPEENGAEVDRIAKEIVRNIGRGFVDLFYHAYHSELISGHIRVEENGVLEQALLSGRGCILATGHVGMFPWLGRPIVERGYPFGPIARNPHDGRLKDVFDDARTRIGYTSIPDRPPMTVMKESLKVLRKGGAVMITFDMHPAGRGGLEVEFFGRKTPMFSTVVRLAARTGVPIVPGHVLWEPDGRHHRATYYPPIEVPADAVDEESPVTRELLQGLADWLSGIIQSHPEQWWGIYRRWR
jgi:KDO2-lipid IV(A) lauroyltransferase